MSNKTNSSSPKEEKTPPISPRATVSAPTKSKLIGNTAARRIAKELAELALDPPDNISAAPTSDKDIFQWDAALKGPPETPYEGGVFRLNIVFPDKYPYRAPKVTFKTKIYHCNIDRKGEICLDLLKDNWSPALTITKVLLSIYSLLADPNPDDPLVLDIAKKLRTEREEHDRIAGDWTRRYALKTKN